MHDTDVAQTLDYNKKPRQRSTHGGEGDGMALRSLK